MNSPISSQEIQESAVFEIIDVEQGSPEWHALRKTKITATDSCVIMGASHWKTKTQLYHEKLSNDPPMTPNARMQRGIDLEPVARDLFNFKMSMDYKSAVGIRGWAMASFDGMTPNWEYVIPLSRSIVEIKCPGEKDHAIALQGKVPDHYYPQLQHQMYVSGVKEAFYFSFDGIDGESITVKRDDKYIEKMLIEEKKFYDCLMNKTPPEPEEGDYIEREDDLWQQCASKWKYVMNSIKGLEKEEEELRNQLIFLSGESNTKGAGISLCQVLRKGNVDYAKIPQLKGIDLDQFRKGSSNSWRISCA